MAQKSGLVETLTVVISNYNNLFHFFKPHDKLPSNCWDITPKELVMENQSEKTRFFLFSLSLWIGFMPIIGPAILAYNELGWVNDILGLEWYLFFGLICIAEIVVRSVTKTAIGKGENAKPWYMSKTVWMNIGIAVLSVLAYVYLGLGSDASLASVLFVTIMTIVARVVRTDRRLTWFPDFKDWVF